MSLQRQITELQEAVESFEIKVTELVPQMKRLNSKSWQELQEYREAKRQAGIILGRVGRSRQQTLRIGRKLNELSGKYGVFRRTYIKLGSAITHQVKARTLSASEGRKMTESLKAIRSRMQIVRELLKRYSDDGRTETDEKEVTHEGA